MSIIGAFLLAPITLLFWVIKNLSDIAVWAVPSMVLIYLLYKNN